MDITRPHLSMVGPLYQLLQQWQLCRDAKAASDHNYFTILAGRSGRAVGSTDKRDPEIGWFRLTWIVPGEAKGPPFKFVVQLLS